MPRRWHKAEAELDVVIVLQGGPLTYSNIKRGLGERHGVPHSKPRKGAVETYEIDSRYRREMTDKTLDQTLKTLIADGLLEKIGNRYKFTIELSPDTELPAVFSAGDTVVASRWGDSISAYRSSKISIEEKAEIARHLMEWLRFRVRARRLGVPEIAQHEGPRVVF